jgi:hypothetical protein
MGAWGHKPFENDTAMDWAFELEDGGLPAVREALESCTPSTAMTHSRASQRPNSSLPRSMAT